MKNTIRFTALLVLVGLGLSACNTVHGMGEDTSAAGHAVQRAAD